MKNLACFATKVRRTMVQNSHESKRKYLATHSSDRSFINITHSFACSALLASLSLSTALICSLARSLTPELVGKCMIYCLKTTWFCPTVQSQAGSFSTLWRLAQIRFIIPANLCGNIKQK